MIETKVSVRAITVERSHFEKLSTLEREHMFYPKDISNAFKIFSGQAAGICYAPDNYMSDGIQNEEAALKRANFNSKSGHYSVFDHAHITFDIECSKALAMLLNSTRLYATSEKSARYTKMKLLDSEQVVYDWWVDKFKGLINVYYSNFKASEVEKLAMENARYLTSVFTPTVMEFTVPYSRAILLMQQLHDIQVYINETVRQYVAESHVDKDPCDASFTYFLPLGEECFDLSNKLRKVLNEDLYSPTLKNHKDMNIRFFTDLTKAMYSEPVTTASDISEYYGDIYKSKYKASLAAVAQIERHRTTHIEIAFPNKLSKDTCYVPPIIKGTPLEDKWKHTYVDLVGSGIVPQCTMVNVIEEGLLYDFILKCKERLCARTQLETTEIVTKQVEKFFANKKNISDACNIANLEALRSKDYNEPVNIRCKMAGYKCNEPCNRQKSNYTRLI